MCGSARAMLGGSLPERKSRARNVEERHPGHNAHTGATALSIFSSSSQLRNKDIKGDQTKLRTWYWHFHLLWKAKWSETMAKRRINENHKRWPLKLVVPPPNLVIATVNSTKAICRSFPWPAKTRELLIFNRNPPGWRSVRFYFPLTAPD